MKKKNGELGRLKSIIETDRLSVGANFDELIESDLTKLLSDYFDLKGEVKIFIEKQNGIYNLSIEANAVRIKPFGSIPE